MLSSFKWSFCGIGGQNLLQFLVLFVLARFLDKTDFGLVGIINMILMFVNIFSLLGIAPAIVQKKTITPSHLSTGMTLSIFFGFIWSIVFFLLSEKISLFFNMPQLEALLKVIVLVFPIIGMSSVANSLLQRELKFKLMAKIELYTYFFSYGIVGILLAYLGFGVWSLIIAQLFQSIISTVWQLILYRYAVRLGFNLDCFKDLIYFGGGFTIARISNYFASQADNFVVGKMMNAYSLGIYSMVFKLVSTPANLIGSVIDRVMFPSMSVLQDKKQQLDNIYYSSLNIIFLILFPIVVFICFYGEEIINVLLGSNWQDAVVPFKILSLSIIFRTAYKISDSLARATGKVYKRAVVQIIYAVMVFFGAVWSCQFGLVGVSISTTIAIFLNYIFMLLLSLSILNANRKKYLILNLVFLFVGGYNVLFVWFFRKIIYVDIHILNLLFGLIFLFLLNMIVYMRLFKKPIVEFLKYAKND